MAMSVSSSTAVPVPAVAENLLAKDPFLDIDGEGVVDVKHQVHIRIQQRNGRKVITTVQGLPPKLNLKKVLKYIKKVFACNGSIDEDEEHGKILKLSGDQRKTISEFLAVEEIVPKQAIKVHGF